MRKISTVQAIRNEILKEQKLTIGVDLGDRWSFYCVLDEPSHDARTLARHYWGWIIAMETGTHSPWMSRLLRELGLSSRCSS